MTFFLVSLSPIFLQCCFVQLLKSSKLYFFVFSFFFIVVVIHFLERNICWWQEGGGGSEAGRSEKINVILHLGLLWWVSAHKKLPPLGVGRRCHWWYELLRRAGFKAHRALKIMAAERGPEEWKRQRQPQLPSTALSLAFSLPFSALLVWQFEFKLVTSFFTRAHEKGNGVWCC